MFCVWIIIGNVKYFIIFTFNVFKRQETIRQAFVRLDEDIYTLESQCLGPRLATIEAWHQHLLRIKETLQASNNLTSNISLDESTEDVQFAPADDKDVISERERLAMVQVCSIKTIFFYFIYLFIDTTMESTYTVNKPAGCGL